MWFFLLLFFKCKHINEIKGLIPLFITDADMSMQSSSPEECYREREAWITMEQFLLLSWEGNAKPGAW